MRGNDIAFLHHALRLAQRGLGRTWPNPSVGCVLVKDNHIIGAARTADGGRPHAETQALAQAGEKARGATAYVSLEPCAHHGQTPPCAQALIDAGVARVVIGAADPDPRVSGKGIAMLQAASIEVYLLLLQGGGRREAAGGGHFCASDKEPPPALRATSPLEGEVGLNRGFFRRIQHGLPYVAMKLATSADYFMARNDGGSQWLTGAAARAHGHMLRSRFDCVLTGIGTVLADDPLLNVRDGGAAHPALIRVVADRRLRLPLTSKLVKTAEAQPVWLITTAESVEQHASHATDLRERGVSIMVVEDVALTPETILRALAAQGITRVLVEAGPTLSTAFLAANMVETLHWYRAPMLLGNTGAAAINALEGFLAAGARATDLDGRALGDDRYEPIELHSGVSSCLPD